MCFAGVELKIIKVLRLLRTLRPLRFITHSGKMKIVVNALLGSVFAILNVGIVIMMVWIMFAILAISFMKDEMGYCDGPEDYYGINKIKCISMGHSWATFAYNFDNIWNAFVTLFVLSSLEGWPSIMGSMFDAAPADKGPAFNGNRIFGSIYLISFILIGSLFLMNLFVGVIFYQFYNALKIRKVA